MKKEYREVLFFISLFVINVGKLLCLNKTHIHIDKVQKLQRGNAAAAVLNAEGAVDNGLLGVDFLLADTDVIGVIAAGEIVALGNLVKAVGDVLCDAVLYVVYDPDEGMLTGAVIKNFAEFKGHFTGLVEQAINVFLKCCEPFFG